MFLGDIPRILLIQDKIGLLPIHIQIQAFRTHKFRMILIQITEIWVLPPTGDSKTIIYIWGTIMLFAAGILVGFTVLAVKKKNRS